MEGSADGDGGVGAEGSGEELGFVQSWVPPPGGYFARKILILDDLEKATICKIFITNELRPKYSIQTTYGSPST